jgi:hypothetical protein
VRREGEQAGRHHGGDAGRGQQRHVEQQVQRDGAAEELGQVGGDGDHLALRTQHPGQRAGQVPAAQGGQALAGGDAELGRQCLDEHGDQVRGGDDPQQPEAIAGTAGHVRGEVARIHVGDRDDEGRPAQGGDPARPAARAGGK